MTPMCAIMVGPLSSTTRSKASNGPPLIDDYITSLPKAEQNVVGIAQSHKLTLTR
jgi:hypothetical protein